MRPIPFLLGLTIAGFMMVIPHSARADCALSNATWGASAAHVGDSVSINVDGTGCNGLIVTARILEYYTDVQVNSVTFQFPNTGTTARGTYIFNTRDVSEGDSKIFKARINAPGLNGIDTGGVTVTGGNCTLSNPYWVNGNGALVGQTITMAVSGSGCSGYSIAFDLYMDQAGIDHVFKTVPGSFGNGANQVTQNTYITNTDWPHNDFTTSVDVYFKAKAGQSSATSPKIKISVDTSSPNPNPSSNPSGSSKGVPYNFSITNPLGSGADDLFGLIHAITSWLVTLAIPIAVIMIIYGGIMFLTAGSNPRNVEKGKDIIKYAIIGLAIVLIGHGFVTLIQSILKLGNSGPAQAPSGQTSPSPSPKQ